MPDPEGIDVERVLSVLKPFQRRSVEYVFDRLYGADATRRFLLADEVGLGKTLVARGVVARAIEHLRAKGEKRIDIVYICSNGDIARQNISRLNVTGKKDFALTSRITLLPKTVRTLTENTLNFVSFTPGTSFNLGQTMGTAEERVLLYHLLSAAWPRTMMGTRPGNVLEGYKDRNGFRRLVGEFRPEQWIDRGLVQRFKERLGQEDQAATNQKRPTYRDQFVGLCSRFGKARNQCREDLNDRTTFIGEMRSLLAATCIDALEPDLVILDEFQRFKDLLNPESAAGSLAKHLFDWGSARVLLLSATPYKMYTLAEESGTDDHYKDFVDTLSFLINDRPRTAHVQCLLSNYGRHCARIAHQGVAPLRPFKQELERELRRVMCRTEKLAVTADRSGMLRETNGQPLTVDSDHLESYIEVRRIARALDCPDVVEYWKASPYLLNFMEGYKLKSELRDALEASPSPALCESLQAAGRSLIRPSAWERYHRVAPCHAILGRLMRETVDSGWWKLLWVPPSLPYYRLEGPFASSTHSGMTKRLVFSSWHVVPRAISILLSYEAERQMITSYEEGARNSAAARDRRRPLLMFTRGNERLTGMPVLALVYPSIALARVGNSSPSRCTNDDQLPVFMDLEASVAGQIREMLAPLLEGVTDSGPEDEAWYWAAPILLDRLLHEADTRHWFTSEKLASAWSGSTEDATGWRLHVEEAKKAATLGRDEMALGRPPADLFELLALLALAGPANCALRALAHTVLDDARYTDSATRHAAGKIAWGFRSLFNNIEVTSLLRGMNGEEPYWRRVLEYCAGGCLQSVLDEYVHLLPELEGLLDRGDDEALGRIAEVAVDAISLRTANPGIDWIKGSGEDDLRLETDRVRSRFAMRFGDERGEREDSGIRKDSVRAAFNSPFWPFVLATTSVGQEGLDFHPYCHAIVHWNLPSNPVDLEQREGRIHRYKGHAVRKNVAQAAQGNRCAVDPRRNPWSACFEHAAATSGGDRDISPFWVFPIEGGAFIERHTPTLPLSREAARLPALRRSLAVYRMVFGQPRQDDLLEHLKRTVGEEDLGRLTLEMAVDLQPGGRLC
jgi:hypothetical protein